MLSTTSTKLLCPSSYHIISTIISNISSSPLKIFPVFSKPSTATTTKKPAKKMAIEKDSSLQVEIASKTRVKPIKSLGKKECQLVTFDLPYLAFYYNQKIMFYKCGDFDDVVKKLKDGLGVVLEDFHQLAGKLGRDEDGVFRVEYDDEMAGVEVTEGTAGEICLADLTDAEGTTMLKHMVPYNGILNIEGVHRPLLAVQITKLVDGVVIGCAFNHAVLDGTSTWHFMSSWAEICRGAESISVPPFLERTKARNTRVKLNLPAELDPFAPTETTEIPSKYHAKPESETAVETEVVSNSDTTAGSGTAVPLPVAVANPPMLREKIFRFSEAAIDKIKSTVNAAPPSDGWKPFSTFQSLSTHIWRHVIEARSLNPQDYTVFSVFADCRKRVDPPMPESYFGNLIQALFTVTAVGMVTAHPPQYAAGLIQKAIEVHNAKAIDDRNKEWENEPKIFQFKDAGVNCVAVGSSPRFKVYDVDFGFGKPESVRSGSNNRFDGMVYLYQGKSGGKSIDVELSLEASAMAELEKDKEFLMEV